MLITDFLLVAAADVADVAAIGRGTGGGARGGGDMGGGICSILDDEEVTVLSVLLQID
jgi:hypothetical protein